MPQINHRSKSDGIYKGEEFIGLKISNGFTEFAMTLFF